MCLSTAYDKAAQPDRAIMSNIQRVKIDGNKIICADIIENEIEIFGKLISIDLIEGKIIIDID